MKKRQKIVIVIIALSILAGFGGYYYIMHGGARDIQSENTSFVVASKDLIAEFNSNSETATKKYLNKAIEISGVVTKLNKKTVTIEESIFCEMLTLDGVGKGKTVIIKGRVVGFDDLLGELKLDACSVSK